jgi:hypothetical protein
MDKELHLRSQIYHLIKSGKAVNAHQLEEELKVGLLHIDAEIKMLEIERKIYPCGSGCYRAMD